MRSGPNSDSKSTRVGASRILDRGAAGRMAAIEEAVQGVMIHGVAGAAGTAYERCTGYVMLFQPTGGFHAKLCVVKGRNRLLCLVRPYGSDFSTIGNNVCKQFTNLQ